MSDDRDKNEHLRRGDDDERYEERDGDLPVEPAPPADDPDDDDVPPGTEPGAET
jgi:hypothetical protein